MRTAGRPAPRLAPPGIGLEEVTYGIDAPVEVAHRAELPLEQDAVTPSKGLVDEALTVDDVRAQPVGRGQVGGADGDIVGRLRDGAGERVILPAGPKVAGHEAPDARQVGRQARLEELGIHQVHDPDPPSGHLVHVGRTDPARGRPEPRLPPLALLELIDQHVVWHDEVRAVADEQAARGDSRRFELIELADKRRRIDHHAVAEQVARRRVEDPRGDQVQLEVAMPIDDGVAGVVAALVAHDEVGVRGEIVDDAALALVTPLGADDGDDGHGGSADLRCGGRPSSYQRERRLGGGAQVRALAGVQPRGGPQALARTLSKQLEQ